MTTQNFTIVKVTSSEDIKAVDNSVMITIQQRIPTRYYSVAIPTTMWHGVALATVPDQFRPLVSGALELAAEKVLDSYLKGKNVETWIPCDRFSLDNLLASSDAGRMTSARLMQLWRNSHKYLLGIAPRLTELQGSALLKLKSAIETHEKKLVLLCSKTAEDKLSQADLDKLLATLAPEDLESPLGEYIAVRYDEVSKKIEANAYAL